MSDPTREMLEDARLQLDMLREALGVSVEPHQSLFERTMERARRMEESDREYSELADYLQSENPAASEAIRALLDDLEESEAEIASKDRALTATRKQLAEAQALEPIAWAVYHGVWKVLTSKHVAEEYAKNNFGDVHPVLSDVPRTAALSAAIAEAVEPYKALATDWLEFAKDVRPGCAAGSDWLSMLRERTIALAAKEAL